MWLSEALGTDKYAMHNLVLRVPFQRHLSLTEGLQQAHGNYLLIPFAHEAFFIKKNYLCERQRDRDLPSTGSLPK